MATSFSLPSKSRNVPLMFIAATSSATRNLSTSDLLLPVTLTMLFISLSLSTPASFSVPVENLSEYTVPVSSSY